MNSISQAAILRLQDGSTSTRRLLFPSFLIFSVCFYAYRFLLGMGSSLTTIYDSDAPTWLRLSKDVVWLAVFLAALVFSDEESRELAWRNWKAHPTFFRAVFALICLFVFMSVIHLFYYQSTMDTLLYWIRYPLEYIPVVFFMPLFGVRWRQLTSVILGLGWLSVGFLFFEMFSDKQMGFYNRYGSILGSPNDYGVFCALFLIGLLACARKWSHWLLMPFMFCGLVLTLSRSAFAGLLAGVFSLLYLRRARVGAFVGAVVLVSLAGILLWKFPDLFGFKEVQYGLAHFTLFEQDNSTVLRLRELKVFQARFSDFDLASLLLGTDYFHIESWYLALVVRTGAFGLFLWLAIMWATVARGWRHRNLSQVHAVATSCLICICVASTFIPYPDTFPTNLYMWLAVGAIWMPVVREEGGLRDSMGQFHWILKDRIERFDQQNFAPEERTPRQ
jgi:hypothetical protein